MAKLLIPCFLLQVWKVPPWIWGNHVYFTPKQSNFKKIRGRYLKFLISSVLQWHMINFVFVATLIFNFLYACFLGLSSWNVLIPLSYGTVFLASWIYWEWDFYGYKNGHMKFFLRHHLCTSKTITLTTNS